MLLFRWQNDCARLLHGTEENVEEKKNGLWRKRIRIRKEEHEERNKRKQADSRLCWSVHVAFKTQRSAAPVDLIKGRNSTGGHETMPYKLDALSLSSTLWCVESGEWNYTSEHARRFLQSRKLNTVSARTFVWFTSQIRCLLLIVN